MRIHCWISDSTIEHFPDSPKRGENGAITRSWGNTLRDPRTDPEADRGGWNGRGKSHGAKKSIERGREPILVALFFPQCHYYYFFCFLCRQFRYFARATYPPLLNVYYEYDCFQQVIPLLFSLGSNKYGKYCPASLSWKLRRQNFICWKDLSLLLLRLNNLNSYHCQYKSIKWSSSDMPAAVNSQEIWHSQ